MDVILYEVFTGHLSDGTEIMVQLFRPQGHDRSQACQFAVRFKDCDSWTVPVQLEHRGVNLTKEANQ